MAWEMVLRFVAGGLIVSLFSVIGEALQPKTFAGLFGAAPSVALVTLGIAYSLHGSAYVATQARSMVFGAFGFLAYSLVCAAALRRTNVEAWLGATGAWIAWAAVAFVGWWALGAGAAS